MGDVSKTEPEEHAASEPEPAPEKAPAPDVRPLDDPIDLDRELRYGWHLFKKNKSDPILATLLMVAILFSVLGLFVIPIMVSLAARAARNPIFPGLSLDMEIMLWQACMLAVYMPLVAWISLGEAKVFLTLARRRRPRPRDLFVMGAGVFPALISFNVASALAQIGSLAFVLPGIAVQMGFSLSVFYIADKGLGPMAALHASLQDCWSLKTVAKMFMLYLAMQFAVLLTCGVGIVIFLPALVLVITGVYLRLSSRVTCVHCGGRVPAELETCPGCGDGVTVLPTAPEGAKPLDMSVAARPAPRWVNPLAMLLLFPLVLAGTSPWGGAFSGFVMAPRFLGLPALLGFGMGLGAVIVPMLASLLLLDWQYRGHRSVRIDEAGAVFGVSERWEGVRIRWRRVQGFWITGGGGLRLQIKRRPWTRWVGPVIPTDERQTHDLVVALEARGLYNLAG